jgi:hypothetical protein
VATRVKTWPWNSKSKLGGYIYIYIYIYIYMDKKNSAIFMPLDVFSVVKVIVMMAKMVCFNLVNYLKLELSKPTLYKVNH